MTRTLIILAILLTTITPVSAQEPTRRCTHQEVQHFMFGDGRDLVGAVADASDTVLASKGLSADHYLKFRLDMFWGYSDCEPIHTYSISASEVYAMLLVMQHVREYAAYIPPMLEDHLDDSAATYIQAVEDIVTHLELWDKQITPPYDTDPLLDD